MKSLHRDFSMGSEDALSSGSSVSSYLGIKLKLKRIEESYDLSGSSESVSGAITTKETPKLYPNFVFSEACHLVQPISSPTISVQKGLGS